MAEVERIWFRRVMAGDDAAPLYCTDDDPDGDWNGATGDAGAVERAVDRWQEEIDFANRWITDAEDLSVSGDDPWRGAVSLRWVLVHMIEEYARHNGHADLLRQRIDGAVGQ